MPSIRRAVMFLVIALLAADAWSQGVGRAQFVSGRVEVERGTLRLPLQVGSQVQQGDVVLTGTDGHVQLVMADSAFVSVRPSSRMRIENYEFDAAKPGAGRALLALVTGALHAFTGEIVARDRNGFKMKTPLATVGIRGSGNILAHSDETGTINHTLTGAHSVTSLDGFGIERTLVSYPGQTVQVRPGQPPRFIPTPTFIMASASPAVKAESAGSERPAQGAQATAAGGGEPAAAAASSSSSSSSSSTSATASTSASSSAASTTPATTPPSESGPISAMPPGAAGSSATVGTSQATAATVGASIVTAQPPANRIYETVFRFFNPLSGAGFEGVLGQSAFAGPGAAVLDAAGRLVQIEDAIVGTFLAGPGQVPAGYSPATYEGTIAFSGGEHHDGFRSPDSSVILGRWTGGRVSIDDGAGGRTFDLGPRSVSYDVTTPTAAGVLGSFSGTSSYTLAAATAPTDAAGNVGSVSAATINANFSARTVSGNFGLAINGQSFSLSGSSDLAPGNVQFSFASALQNLAIACSGNCSTLGYLGTLNGQFAGAAGDWISVSYRINPGRVPNNGFSDYVIGNIALNSNVAPTIGIVLPQSGTANLSFTAADPARSVSNFPQASGPPVISGAVQANFTSRTASFTATVSGSSLPSFTASASNIPIVGAVFSASTDAQRPASVGSMTVACSGTGCGASGSTFGRFDGLFRNSAGTSGIATLLVGDSGGSYDVTAGFGATTSATARLAAADGRNALRRLSGTSPIGMAVAGLRSNFGGATGGSRIP